jgi:hypothetical protein
VDSFATEGGHARLEDMVQLDLVYESCYSSNSYFFLQNKNS